MKQKIKSLNHMRSIEFSPLKKANIQKNFVKT